MQLDAVEIESLRREVSMACAHLNRDDRQPLEQVLLHIVDALAARTPEK